MRPSVFDVMESIERYGFWYAIWRYGAKRIWTIFVATRMIKRDNAAQRAHADWHYGK